MEQESFTELLVQLAGNSAQLVRDEIALAKQEVREDLTKVRSTALIVASGAVLCLLGLMTLCAALVIFLTSYLSPAGAALVTGLGLTTCGIAAAWIGLRQLKRLHNAP